MPKQANPTDNHVRIPAGPSHHGITKSQRPTGDVSPGVPCCSKTQQNSEVPQPQTDQKSEQTTRGPLRNQSDSANLQSDGVQSVQRSQATQVYLKTKTVSTCSNYVTDELDTEQFIYTVLQQVVQQTQKHMYKHLQQSMQQTYLGLSLSTPVRAKEFISKFTDTDYTLILTKNRRPTVTPLDKTAFDAWNTDSWDDSTTVTADSANGDKAANTEVKQIEGAEAPGPSCASGDAQRKTGFPATPNQPSVLIEGTPASFEDLEDYFNPRIVSTLPLYTTSLSFAAAVNIRSCPPHQQGGVHD